MARKRCSKQATTERQNHKRARLAGALTPSETATPPTEPSSLLFNDNQDLLMLVLDRNAADECVADQIGASTSSPPPVPEKKSIPPFVEPVVINSQSLLVEGGHQSRRVSIAGDGEHQHSSSTSTASCSCCGSVDHDCSSSFLRYDSEESCLSLSTLEIDRKESYYDSDAAGADIRRRQENHHQIVVHEYHPQPPRPRTRRHVLSCLVVFVGFVVGFLCNGSFGIDWTGASFSTVVDRVFYRPSRIEKDSICVSGGGFSGFWFILGRLQSISDPSNKKNYYCFSAGCLGLVASLRGIAMDDVHRTATDLQTRWKNGEIGRHQVLTLFVDSLLVRDNSADDGTSEMGSVVDPDLPFLNRLNVLTTVRDGWIGLRTSTRTPTSAENLRTLLIQSAWIPFVVGNELFHESHMDGAFFLFGHPRCEHSVGLPSHLDVLSNILNVNLSADKVQKFWKMGIERGL